MTDKNDPKIETNLLPTPRLIWSIPARWLTANVQGGRVKNAAPAESVEKSCPCNPFELEAPSITHVSMVRKPS